MRIYTTAEVAARFGISKRGLEKWLQTRRRLGYVIPGVTALGKHTDESLEWIREQRAPLTSAAGRPIRGRQSQPTTDDIDDFLDGGNPQDDQDAKPWVTKPAQSAHVPAVVTGLTPASRIPDARELWEDAERHQARDVDKIALRYSQEVVIPDERPVLLVLLSDAHFGNAHTNYIQARKDAELVRDSDGVYAAFLGDLIDGWITPQLGHIQREQPMTLHRELMLAESWLCMMSDKLIAVVSGNHDLRVYEAAGLDLLAGMLSRVHCLYDQHEINFTLRLGKAAWRWKARHEWKHRSQANPSNQMEWDARWNDGTWDFAVGGHDHTPTLLRPFIDSARGGRKKAAIKLGCYSLDSPYGRALNRERLVPGGSLGIMLWPDGDWQEFYSLDKAVRFLAMERAR